MDPSLGFHMSAEVAGMWIASFLTLAAFSFLYRDNPIYKVAEHIYVGVAAGYGFYQAFWGTIYPNLFRHVFDGMSKISQGTEGAWLTQWRWGALVMGLLVLSRLVPKWSWISRWPMALIVGAFAGLNLVGFAQANLIDQVNGTLVPLFGRAPGADATMPWFLVYENGTYMVAKASIMNNFILVVGVVTVLTYFFFSPVRSDIVRRVGQVGICVVMVTFGATYGSIVLARISLLIGRLQMLTEANAPQYGYPPIVCAVLIVAVLILWRILYFRPEEPMTPPEETSAAKN
jgi:hypothetical protein